jgi:folate-binding protein YgfZ
MMYYTPLSSRAFISVIGQEAEPFLQGLITNDMRKLAAAPAIYAALLTPQGKFLHDFFVLPVSAGDGYLLDTDRARSADLLARLNLYKLRSKVMLALEPETIGVVVLWGENSEQRPAAGGQWQSFADPRHVALGWRMVGNRSEIVAYCQAQGFTPAAEEAYDLHRLTLGIPEAGTDIIPEKNFLLECGFEALSGVDFTKGCYVGQEVTARSKYRGQVKKCLMQVKSEKALPAPGTAVVAGDKTLGELRSSRGNIGLALIRQEELAAAQAAGLSITAENIPLSFFENPR